MTSTYHIPALAFESILGMNIRPGVVVVDATYGGGGHSRLILEKIGNGKLYVFDQDEDALVNAIDDERLVFIRHNFRYLRNFLRYYKVNKVDAIFADFGVSSHDFDVPERGFSFRFEGKLDMRMNQKSKISAEDVINSYSSDQLKFVFKIYGEINNVGRLVAQIIKKRAGSKIETTKQLKEIAAFCAPRATENKYMAKVFQALRIEVNDEMEVLKDFLKASLECLTPGGRLVLISYHSLEDRLCKNFIKSGNFEGKIEKDFYGNVVSPFKVITRKVIVPGQQELERNPRSRSAKLRIAEKI